MEEDNTLEALSLDGRRKWQTVWTLEVSELKADSRFAHWSILQAAARLLSCASSAPLLRATLRRLRRYLDADCPAELSLATTSRDLLAAYYGSHAEV